MLHCGDGVLGVMRGVGFAPGIAFSFPHAFWQTPNAFAQLCRVYDLKWSYGQILQSPLWSFAAPSGLFLVSLLPLWIMPSLSGLYVLVGGSLLAGLLWCNILSFFYIGF
jgi:hypothetical protein